MRRAEPATKDSEGDLWNLSAQCERRSEAVDGAAVDKALRRQQMALRPHTGGALVQALRESKAARSAEVCKRRGLHVRKSVFRWRSPFLCSHLSVHTSLFTPLCSRPSVHTFLFTPLCSHLSVHTSLFTLSVHASLFTPLCYSHLSVHRCCSTVDVFGGDLANAVLHNIPQGATRLTQGLTLQSIFERCERMCARRRAAAARGAGGARARERAKQSRWQKLLPRLNRWVRRWPASFPKVRGSFKKHGLSRILRKKTGCPTLCMSTAVHSPASPATAHTTIQISRHDSNRPLFVACSSTSRTSAASSAS